MTTTFATKLLRAAPVALALALIPCLAAAETAPAQATQQFVMTATPSATLSDMAPAAAARGGRGEVGSFALGPTIGFSTGNDITAFRITGEGQYTITELAPNFYLDMAGHLGLALGSVSCPPGFSCPSVTIFEIVPAARFRYVLPSESRVSFYGDGGLGIAFASGGGASQTWGIFRIAGGVQYKVTPNIILLGEPLGLNIYFGTGSGFMYSLAAGVLFKI